jgi:two-component system LytT family response regulator
MKAIIIDDEQKGRETLSKLLTRFCPAVAIIASASNAEDGYAFIRKHKPDLVFLDIEMPNENGFSLLSHFDEIPFEVIFITAYDSYAIQAIRHHALDYLLKPVDIDELRAAVKNAEQAIARKPAVNRYLHFVAEQKMESSRIPLSVKEGLVYITISDIIRIESDSSYSTFFCSDGKKYMVSKNLGEYEALLPQQLFFRSHKSHLINIKKVKKFLRNDGFYAEMEDGSLIEVSRRKKDDFLQLMGGDM